MEQNTNNQEMAYKPLDYKNNQPIRWCPGCGDHAVLNVLLKSMAQLGIPPEKTAVISGIGCSSRLPYYTNDVNLLLLNNRIYGLTKGQFSPTSARGFKSKSSPYGTTEDPFVPAELTFGARGTFFARSMDVELNISQEVMMAAARHKGCAVVEILQNCMIFNNGIHSYITDREHRADRTIHLVHGEKMIFGKDNNRGLVQDGFGLKAVTIGEDGYTIDDVLVHDAHCESNFLHQMLAKMDGTDLPVALGVIRAVEAPTYETAVAEQVEEAKKMHGFTCLRDVIMAGDTWEVE